MKKRGQEEGKQADLPGQNRQHEHRPGYKVAGSWRAQGAEWCRELEMGRDLGDRPGTSGGRPRKLDVVLRERVHWRT